MFEVGWDEPRTAFVQFAVGGEGLLVQFDGSRKVAAGIYRAVDLQRRRERLTGRGQVSRLAVNLAEVAECIGLSGLAKDGGWIPPSVHRARRTRCSPARCRLVRAARRQACVEDRCGSV